MPFAYTTERGLGNNPSESRANNVSSILRASELLHTADCPEMLVCQRVLLVEDPCDCNSCSRNWTRADVFCRIGGQTHSATGSPP